MKTSPLLGVAIVALFVELLMFQLLLVEFGLITYTPRAGI